MEIEGIVIRITPYKEKDAMVNVLTKDGIMSFLARGVLSIDSKNAASVTQYAYSRFEFNDAKEKSLSLKNGTLIKGYNEAFKSLDKLAALSFIGELTLKATGEEDASAIYEYALQSLEAIEAGFDVLTIVLVYYAQVLKVAGYGLEVQHCVFCGETKGIVTVSYPDGGFVCQNCFDATSMKARDARYLKIIRYLFMVGPDEIKRVTFSQEEALVILDEFTVYASDQLGVGLKSYGLLINSLKK